MSRRPFVSFLVVLIAAVAGFLWLRRKAAEQNAIPPAVVVANSPSATEPRPTAVAIPVSPAAARPAPESGAVAITPTEARITIADDLNAAGGTVQRDLRILQDVLDAWRSNFPQDGNPWGANLDITAELTGGNTLKLALIPKGHPAINADGELCDRWGTPFHFHAMSGTRMEIRSAGPDRVFGTADDAKLVPEGGDIPL